MNDEYSDDSLLEAIIEKGEVVYSVFWDSGSPGAGAEYECIYRYDDKYYPVLSFDDSVVAYNTFEEALMASELYTLNETCKEITSKEIPADRLVQLLQFKFQLVPIKINGETWLASSDGSFQKIPSGLIF